MVSISHLSLLALELKQTFGGFFLDNKSIPALDKLNKYLLSSNVKNSSYVYANKVPMVRKYSKTYYIFQGCSYNNDS
jgi:hypothetical protein